MAKEARQKLEENVRKLLQLEGFTEGGFSLNLAISMYTSVIDKKSGSDGTLELNQLAQKLDEKLSDPDGAVSYEKVEKKLTRSERYAILLDILRELETSSVLKGQPLFIAKNKTKKSSSDEVRRIVLAKYPVPKFIYDALENCRYENLGLDLTVGPENYADQFQKCLWIEEAYQELEMLKFSLDGINMKKNKEYFKVEVPGLSEGRPSIVVGDILLLKNLCTKQYYEGNVHHLGEKHVLIKCNDSLHRDKHATSDSFDVTFRPSRGALRWLHFGLSCYKAKPILREIVFPDPDSTGKARHMIEVNLGKDRNQQMKCFRPNLSACQRTAVLNVLKAVSRPAPYIIFGPPGTGKTITVVEAILQIYSRKSDSKILVCGNSNSCADLLARLILESNIVPRGKLIRLIAFSRQELVPPKLRSITRTIDMISNQLLSKIRIIVCTCSQSGSLNNFDKKIGSFDYVFIDEAGHASEPETLLPLGLLKKGGCVVLAGDPHQLGPFCQFAEKLGTVLGTSLLEALTTLPMYMKQKDEDGKCRYDERYITKLIVSFRSDPRLTEVNNRIFYDGELEFKNITPEKWMKVFKVDKPQVFRAVKGKERKISSSPSCWNPAELFACLFYVKRLYWRGLKKDQLGIITPYRLQIRQLNNWFDTFGIKKCKIDTIEAFQGEEREVMIISTVRTYDPKLSDEAMREKLKFLFSPKRFNVATSRAKWLNIVIGDPKVLKLDPNWRDYIEEAVEHVVLRKSKNKDVK